MEGGAPAAPQTPSCFSTTRSNSGHVSFPSSLIRNRAGKLFFIAQNVERQSEEDSWSFFSQILLRTLDHCRICRCGQLSLAPHFVQKVAEEKFCAPQVGQSLVPASTVVVGSVGIWPGRGCEILARLE